MKTIDNIRNTRYYLLNIDLSDKESYTTSGLIFIRTQAGIDVERNLGEAPLVDMLAVIPGRSNVLIVLSGCQILTRFSSEERNTLFEEIKDEDFYIQKVVTDNGWMIQSACRRSILDPLVHIITAERRFLLDFSLGPVAVPVLADQFDNQSFIIDHIKFHFQKQQLASIQEYIGARLNGEGGSDQTITIGENQLSESGVNLLAALIGYFREGPAEIRTLRENGIQARFYRFFKTGALITTGVLFVVLLSNFLLFSHLQKNLNQLRSSNKDRTEQIGEIDRLKIQIAEYKNLVSFHSSGPQSTYSFYTDHIAQYRPAGVWLNSLEIHPLIKKPEPNKSLNPENALITITGVTKDPVSLNKFMNQLKEQDWIQDIALKNYETTTESRYADFELEIRK